MNRPRPTATEHLGGDSTQPIAPTMTHEAEDGTELTPASHGGPVHGLGRSTGYLVVTP